MTGFGTRIRTRVLVAVGLLASSLSVGIAAQEVRAAAVSLPSATYRISVDVASGIETETTYTGRGSWTNVELLNGQLAAPLFKVAGDQKVPACTSVIVSEIDSATAVWLVAAARRRFR